MESKEVFLSYRQVKERYGNVSDMWLHRREKDKSSNFPRPIRIQGRKFWRLSDLISYERELEAA